MSSKRSKSKDPERSERRHRSSDDANKEKKKHRSKSKEKESSKKEKDKEKLKDKDKIKDKDKNKEKKSSSKDRSHKSEKRRDSSSKSTKKEEPEKSSVEVKTLAPPQVSISEEYTYEDDFEEYEDDFEEDDSEPEAVKLSKSSGTTSKPIVTGVPRLPSPSSPANSNSQMIQSPLATSTENESLLLKKMATRSEIGGGNINGSGLSPYEETQLATSTGRVSSAQRKIDFANARERGYLAQTEWFSHFKDIIQIDTVCQQIADIPPLSTYEYYINVFGKHGRSQGSTQTGDDNATSQTQTDEQECDSVWTQFPANDNLGLGWGRNVSDDGDSGNYDSTSELKKIRGERFSQFVEVAGQLIIDMISSRDRTKASLMLSNKSKLAMSSGYETYMIEYMDCESRVTAMAVQDMETRQTLLGAYFVTNASNLNLIGRTIICEHAIAASTAPPQFSLIADNEVTALCYGPEDSPVVCAGLIDGSILIYNTNEPQFYHSKYQVNWPGVSQPINLQVPSYNTANDSCDKHFAKGSAIVWLVSVGEASQFAFQLIAINQQASILIFTVTETMESESVAASDFGLNPHSRVKLVRTNVINNTMPLMKWNSLAANCMVVNPSNYYQVLIATNEGSIVNFSRVKTEFCGPRIYSTETSAEVICIRFSHFDSNFFSAGLSCGHVLVYQLRKSKPLLRLIPPSSCKLSVTHVEWSPTTSHILYSVHGGERVLIWDIATSKSPLYICDVKAEFGARIVNLVVSKIEHTIGVMGFGLSDGKLMIHALERLVVSREEALEDILLKYQSTI